MREFVYLRRDDYIFLSIRRNYSFTITAREGAQAVPAMATVIIQLIDVNDNPPVFLAAPYTFNVSENQQPPVSIGTVTAMDIDDGTNAQV